VGPNDIITVISGQNQGKIGVVMHVYQDFLFYRARDMVEHGGIFVTKVRDCELHSGGNHRWSSSHRSFARRSGRARKQKSYERKRRDYMWIDWTVKIKKGAHKGYLGMVKEADQKKARVELTGKFKVISILLDDLTKFDNDPIRVLERG